MPDIVHGRIPPQRVQAFRADRNTHAAVHAQIAMKQNYGLCRLPFRIGAPQTSQGASLKKNKRANARAIVNAVFLNIEYSRALCGGHVFLFIQERGGVSPSGENKEGQ